MQRGDLFFLFWFTYVIFHVINHFLLIYVCKLHWNPEILSMPTGPTMPMRGRVVDANKYSLPVSVLYLESPFLSASNQFYCSSSQIRRFKFIHFCLFLFGVRSQMAIHWNYSFATVSIWATADHTHNDTACMTSWSEPYVRIWASHACICTTDTGRLLRAGCCAAADGELLLL